VIVLDPEEIVLELTQRQMRKFGTSTLQRMLVLVVNGLANSQSSSSTKESCRPGMNISRIPTAVQKQKVIDMRRVRVRKTQKWKLVKTRKLYLEW
jgi:hypothetical protein